MSDLYLKIAEQPDEVLAAIAASMDDRVSDPNMRDICASYMSRLPRPGATLLEIGCGNGASTELLLEFAEPGQLVGVDPADGLLDRARARFGQRAGVTFLRGDAVDTGMADESVDVVVAHTVYSHLPDPKAALAEAFRVLKPGGTLAIFDGDYATNTVALFDGDPLQAAMTATQRNLIHDIYIMRRLPGMIVAAGFGRPESGTHGFVQTEKPDYLLSLAARGCDAAVKAGECSAALADGFKSEMKARVADGTFYGAILFVSVLATKPG